MKVNDARAIAELLFDELRTLQQESDKRGHDDISRVISTAIVDIGCAIEKVERCCKRSNKRLGGNTTKEGESDG